MAFPIGARIIKVVLGNGHKEAPDNTLPVGTEAVVVANGPFPDPTYGTLKIKHNCAKKQHIEYTNPSWWKLIDGEKERGSWEAIEEFTGWHPGKTKVEATKGESTWKRLIKIS